MKPALPQFGDTLLAQADRLRFGAWEFLQFVLAVGVAAGIGLAPFILWG
mgnify:CR=1 FL=1